MPRCEKSRSLSAVALAVSLAVSLTVTLTAFLAPAARAAEPDASQDALALVEAVGFEAAQVRDLLAGKIVSRQLGDEAKDELAVVVGMRVPKSVASMYDEVGRHEFFSVDQTILAWGPIDEGAVDASDFASLQLPADELDSLAKAKPGTDFNLSSAEFAAMRDAVDAAKGKPAGERNQALMRVYRELLARRVAAYRERGLAGIEPYARKSGVIAPEKSLGLALPKADSPIARRAPEFYRVLKDYPAGGLGEIASEQLWLLQKINGRAAVILAHRIRGTHSGDAFLAQRDFYVGHDFSALQIVVGVLPFEGGSLVLYGNRTYTEQVAGFGSGAAHSIGRGMLIREVETLFRAILEAATKS